ncbi:MAG: hypothetical protein ACLVKO_05640 [Dysgonomonas sp.]
MANSKSPFKKFLTYLLVIIIVGGIGFFIFWFYVPFSSSSVRAGQLNYVMYKGVIFKTWEGKLIQSGFRSQTAGKVQSNEFEFSIKNEELAKKLMNYTGKDVMLHYKEYYGTLPWRGYTKFIVDSIVSVKDHTETESIPLEALN